MPQVGEQRKGATETVEWNGSRWAPVASVPAAAPEQGSALGRFFNGALSTSPLNPMNLVRAASSPGKTIAGMIADPLKNAFQVPGDLADVVTNARGGGPVMGRVTSALEALKHIGGSVPLIGPAGVEAGSKVGEGDIAGGAGELAGIASGALVPKVAGAAPEAISKVGRGAEAAGTALKGSRFSVGGVSVPLTGIGAAEALFGNHPIAGTALAATPYALEYGGRGLQKVGGALSGLKEMVSPSEADVSGNYKGPRAKGAGDVSEYNFPEEVGGVSAEAPLSPIEQFNRDNPPGEGRTTGSFEEGPSGLSSVAERSKARGASPESVMNDMQDSYGHGLQQEPPLGHDVNVPEDFSFEGESTGVPGEYPVGPAAPGFTTQGIPWTKSAAQKAFHTKFLKDLVESAGGR